MKAMNKKIKGIVAVIKTENIDTDQIIPAESLKTTSKQGLGKFLFANWRYYSHRSINKAFVLNKEPTKHAKILVAGDNFGCGSSREHAAWALRDFGFKAIISSTVADIFKNNAIKNGLLPIEVPAKELQELYRQNANTIEIDIESQLIKNQDFSIHFKLEAFTKYCFINGVDELDYLLNKVPQIIQYELQRN
jgi:3-isopropylmalate/(R)-2-methylmalate dehydratase small subunit